MSVVAELASLPSALRDARRSALSVGRVVQAVLVVGAALYVAAFVAEAAFRIFFPYPLEITEGASLEVVRGLLEGRPLYTQPTPEHVPMIYGPVYFYAAAALARLTGASFATLRTVSIVASIGSIVFAYVLVQHETGSRAAGLVAAGLLAASYPLTDGALDLGRVDALLLCLLLASLLAARMHRPLAAGALIALAVLTKQAAVPVAVALLVYFGLAHRKRLVAFTLGLAATLSVPLAVLELQSGHWATLFLIQLPLQHQISDFRLGAFWSQDILPHFTLAFAVAPLFLLGRARAKDYRTILFYTLATASMLGIAWAANSNPGAAANVRLTAYAILAIAFALGLHDGLYQLSRLPARERTFWMYGACIGILQLMLLVYNPRSMVPYRSDGWADDRLSAALDALPGAVFAPDFDAFLARTEQPYAGSAAELLGGYGGKAVPDGQDWVHQVEQRLQQRQFDYVVLDPESPLPIFKGIVDRTGYVDAGPLFQPTDEFWLWRTGIEPKAEGYVPSERSAHQ